MKRKHLLRLGVPEALLPLVRTFSSDSDLGRHEDDLPREGYEALYLIAAGHPIDLVFREMDKAPEGETSDPKDFGAALARDDSRPRFHVVDEAKDLAELLTASLAAWHVCLRPKQRRLVELHDARQLNEQGRRPIVYRSVVVDEAHDMSPEAFRLIRALGACGIDIRGRGRRLRLNYLTTNEIGRCAVRLLEGRAIDDLDSARDDQHGYLSLTHGEAPLVRAFGSAAEECPFLAQEIRRLIEAGSPAEAIAVVARTSHGMEECEWALGRAGLPVHGLRRDAADVSERLGVRVATMHRVKGLEFEHVFVAGASESVVPLPKAVPEDDDPASREDAETSERALLYVVLTRAKRSAFVTAPSRVSPYLA